MVTLDEAKGAWIALRRKKTSKLGKGKQGSVFKGRAVGISLDLIVSSPLVDEICQI